jgi:hypothetical protein
MENLVEEMFAFCRITDEEAIHRYILIKKIIKDEFYQPEFDILRNEIGRCYVLQAHQACITLTNHLLERYCKILVVYFETGFKTIDDLDSIEEGFEVANKKYMRKDLSSILNVCKKLKLISKDDWKLFDKYREIFRNGYSHADPQKILGNTKGSFLFGSFNDSKKSELKELTFSKIPFLQGVAIEAHSQNNALPYFIAVENLIRKTIHNIQPDEYKIDYQLIKLVKKEIDKKNL